MPTSESLRALLEGACDAMLIVDESGEIMLTNQRALDLFGYTPAELDGQSVELLIPERFRLQHIGHRLRFTDAVRMRPMGTGSQLFALCKDGSERPVNISLSSVQRGLHTLVVVAVRHVNEHTGRP